MRALSGFTAAGLRRGTRVKSRAGAQSAGL